MQHSKTHLTPIPPTATQELAFSSSTCSASFFALCSSPHCASVTVSSFNSFMNKLKANPIAPCESRQLHSPRQDERNVRRGSRRAR